MSPTGEGGANLFKKPSPPPTPVAPPRPHSTVSAAPPSVVASSGNATSNQITMQLLIWGLGVTGVAILLGVIGGAAVFIVSLLVGVLVLLVTMRVAATRAKNGAPSRDKMRIFAWCLVGLGPVFAIAYVIVASVMTSQNIDAWVKAENQSMSAARSAYVVDMLSRGLVPTWTVVAKWPGMLIGAGTTAFGVLILAIRRSEPKP
jgi:hypothetical protein